MSNEAEMSPIGIELHLENSDSCVLLTRLKCARDDMYYRFEGKNWKMYVMKTCMGWEAGLCLCFYAQQKQLLLSFDVVKLRNCL